MKWDWRKLGAIGVALLAVLAAAGCPDSDVLQVGNGSLALEVRLENNNSRFDFATFTITDMRLRPQDPEADAALGNDIRLLSQQLFVDFVNPILQIPSIPLSSGIYRVTRLEMRDFSLNDFDPPASSATCEEFVDVFDALGNNVVLTASLAPGTLEFTVLPNGESDVVMSIDVDAFITAFTGSHICQQNCGGLAWCTTGFDEAAFIAETNTYLSFE